MFKGEPFVVILCLIGITTFGIYLTRRMRKENLLRDKIDHDTVVFFERAAEIYLVLFKHFDQTTTFDLCSAIERLVSDLTDTIKMSPNLRDPSEPDQDPVAEERLLLKTAVDLVVHLELMGTNKINALLSNKNDCEALKKYRAEMLYKKLFETA